MFLQPAEQARTFGIAAQPVEAQLDGRRFAKGRLKVRSHLNRRRRSNHCADACYTGTEPTQIILPWRTGAQRKLLKIRLVACRYQECKAAAANLLTGGKVACKFGLGISRTALEACFLKECFHAR
jgi:hypothetical protein